MLQGIHHVAMIVSSEKSVDFYKRLGFAESLRVERKYDTVVLLAGFGTELELFVDANHPAREVDPERIGLRHIALRVDNIEKMAEELDVEIGPIMQDWRGIRFAFMHDPDGLPIELHE